MLFSFCIYGCCTFLFSHSEIHMKTQRNKNKLEKFLLTHQNYDLVFLAKLIFFYIENVFLEISHFVRNKRVGCMEAFFVFTPFAAFTPSRFLLLRNLLLKLTLLPKNSLNKWSQKLLHIMTSTVDIF